MTDFEAIPEAGTCGQCGGTTIPDGRGMGCRSCSIVWVGDAPIPMQDAHVYLVAGILLAKCISQGTILPRFYVGYPNAKGALDASEQQYFRDAVDLMKKLNLIGPGEGTETYGIRRPYLREAREFALKWADPKRAARVALGSANVKSLSAEPVEPKAEPASPAQPGPDYVTRQELENVLRMRRQTVGTQTGADAATLVDLNLKIHGLEIQVEEMQRFIDSLRKRDLVDRTELEHIPTIDELEAHTKSIEGYNDMREDQQTKLVETLMKITQDSPVVKMGAYCLCGEPGSVEVQMLGRDPSTHQWTRNVGRKRFVCLRHERMPVYYLEPQDVPYLRTHFPRGQYTKDWTVWLHGTFPPKAKAAVRRTLGVDIP